MVHPRSSRSHNRSFGWIATATKKLGQRKLETQHIKSLSSTAPWYDSCHVLVKMLEKSGWPMMMDITKNAAKARRWAWNNKQLCTRLRPDYHGRRRCRYPTAGASSRGWWRPQRSVQPRGTDSGSDHSRTTVVTTTTACQGESAVAAYVYL